MRTHHLIACGLAALSLVAAGCSEEESEEAAGGSESDESVQLDERQAAEAPSVEEDASGKPRIAVPDARPPRELETEDLREGDGAVAEPGSQLSVNYVGVAYSTGREFDSNFGGQPFVFQLGGGMVIPGWDQGLQGMKVGGRRQLTIPSELAYGAQGFPPDIAPNETLIFVIDLLDVQ